MTSPEPITGYDRTGEPFYADDGLEDAYEDLHEIIMDRLDDEAGYVVSSADKLAMNPAARDLWPAWLECTTALVERENRRAAEYAAHEARLLAELEQSSPGDGDRPN